MLKIYDPFYLHYKCIADSCPMNCCTKFRISFFKWEEAQFNTKPEWSDIDGNGNDIKKFLDHDRKGWFCKDGSKGNCQFWGTDGLCEIQKRFGPDAMPSVCRTFPRVVTKYPDRMEYALDACCPVVAASVWNWEIGTFITEGEPCGKTVHDSLTERRNAAIRILAADTASFTDCLKQIAGLFHCNTDIPDIILPDDRMSFIRKMTILLIWSDVLRHEHSNEGNEIMTLLLEFITEYSKHLGQTEYASRWDMSVDFSDMYIRFQIGTPIEPDDEERFIDIIPK